jgi:hypothetical protein
MALTIKRNPDGRLVARNNPGPELFLLARSRRMANQKQFDVRHYMVPSTRTVVYAIKNLSMSMLHNSGACNDNQFGGATRQVGVTKPVYYEGVVFMVFPNVQEYGKCFLVNKDNNVLAGSNLFDGNQYGAMCLGTSIDPTNLSPIDALCFNAANRDLGWSGSVLTGVWEPNPDPERPRARSQIFKITTWPTWTHLRTPIPPQVIDACKDW